MYRESVIPLFVQHWLQNVGVDLTKEIDVSEYEGESSTNLYFGEYLFVGKVLSGPDPYIPNLDGNGALMEPVEIFPGFNLGLSSSVKFGPPVPESFQGKPLVQVMFKVRTPPSDAT